MSSVQSFVECPQCGYEQADYLYRCRTDENATMCRRCGYYECWDAKYDEDGDFCGWKHEISRGAGALWGRGTGQGIFRGDFCNTKKEVLDAERWLREALDKGTVDPDVSYLTKWNRETEQVEFIFGKFYEWPETDEDESRGEVAPPVPSSQSMQPNHLNAAGTPTDGDDLLPF